MSNARNLANLLGTDTKIKTADIADEVFNSNRNLIINGAMQEAQRGTSFSSLSASAYTCDRWQLQVAGAGRGTVTQESSGGPVGFKDNFLRVTVATADSSVASSDMQVLKQVIEGHVAAFTDAGTSDAKPLTLSFYVRSSVTGTFSATLYTNFNNPSAVSYPAEYTISSANTWEQKTITFPAFTTSSTLVTSGYTNGEFYQVRFALMAGSDKTGTANQWNSANDFASTNQTNLFATSSATWDITGIQLEVGEQATPFEHRSFGDEFLKCQRYYAIKENNTGSSKYFGYVLQAYNSSSFYGILSDFPITMRATPTVSQSGTFGAYTASSGLHNTSATIGNFFGTNTSWGTGGWSGDSTLTAGHAGVFFAQNNAKFIADAEL